MRKNNSDLGLRIKEGMARFEAYMYLRAYMDDENPQHILNAYRAYRRLKVVIPESMLKNLDFAHAEIERRLPRSQEPGRPGISRKNTLRDLHILRSILLRYKTDQIPRRIERSYVRELALQYRTTAGAVLAVIREARRQSAGAVIQVLDW